MEFSKEELIFLHCLLGGCDDYLIKHAMKINEEYTDEEKTALEKYSIKVFGKIDRFLNKN